MNCTAASGRVSLHQARTILRQVTLLGLCRHGQPLPIPTSWTWMVDAWASSQLWGAAAMLITCSSFTLGGYRWSREQKWPGMGCGACRRVWWSRNRVGRWDRPGCEPCKRFGSKAVVHLKVPNTFCRIASQHSARITKAARSQRLSAKPWLQRGREK